MWEWSFIWNKVKLEAQSVSWNISTWTPWVLSLMAAVRAGGTLKSHPVGGHESWWRSFLLTQARRQCSDRETEERPCGGLSRPLGVSSLSNTTWGGGEGKRVLAAPSRLEFHSKVLRLNICRAKHSTVCSSNARQLEWPLGLLTVPGGCLCHLVVNAARVSEAPSYTCLGLLRHSFPPHPGLGAKFNSWLNTFTFHLLIQERQVAGWWRDGGRFYSELAEKGFQERALLFGHTTRCVS